MTYYSIGLGSNDNQWKNYARYGRAVQYDLGNTEKCPYVDSYVLGFIGLTLVAAFFMKND